MKKLIYSLVATVWLFSLMFVTISYALDEKIDWIYKGVSMSDRDPDLKHYVWETVRPPHGPWDKIRLHRYVNEPQNKDAVPNKPSVDPRKVLFHLPGTWDVGIPVNSNPAVSHFWFFAENGYDVYAIDYRTSFVPKINYAQFQELGYGDALKATVEWTYALFREDIKAGVELAKKISGAKKVFMSGHSRGGSQTYFYAAKYYKEDLNALIPWDGGGIWLPLDVPSKQMTEAQWRKMVTDFKNGLLSPPPDNLFLTENGGRERSLYAEVVPYSLKTVGFKTLEDDMKDIQSRNPPGTFPDPPAGSIKTISDLVAWTMHYTWGPARYTNFYEGYIDRDVAVKYEAHNDRYWPTIQNMETIAMLGYSDCPFLDYDNTRAITLPVLFFGTEFACPRGSCLDGKGQPYKVASTDVTIVYLEGQGHIDMLVGTRSLETVKKPMLKWMNDRLK